jgi:hypothetical protein
MLSAIFAERLLTTFVVMLLFILIYFAFDIFEALTGYDFRNVSIYKVHFTRTEKDPKGTDSVNCTIIGPRITLKDVYKSKLLILRVLKHRFFEMNRGSVVFDFGKYTYQMLSPFRDRVSAMCTSAEMKRSAGFQFVRTKYMVCMTLDSDPERRNKIIRVLIIREIDLKNIESFIMNPPKAGENKDLVMEVMWNYKENPRSFIHVQVTAA